jgi:hypothetical protein
MDKRGWVHIGGSFMSAIWTAASIILNFKDIGQNHKVSWFWPTCAAIGFVIFAALVYYGWYSEWRHVQRLEDESPIVDIKPRYIGRKAWFDVTNTGAHSANFILRLRLEGAKVVGINEESFTFDAKWRHTKDSPTLELMSNNTHEIDAVESQGIQGFEEKEKREGLNVFTAFETKGAVMPLDGILSCQVVVFSEPPLKQPFDKTYILRLSKDGSWKEFSEVNES